MSPGKRIFLARKQAGQVLVAGALAAGLLASACAPAAREIATPPLSAPTRAGRLTPYFSATPPAQTTVTPADAAISTPTLPPSPTPTLRTHVVKKGEDMGGIAFLYRVSLEALMAANPTVQPRLMSVGTTLVIPPSSTPMPGDTPAPNAGAEPPTPTAVPLELGLLSCARAEDGGVWCFQPVTNAQSFTLEGISAVIRLGDRQGHAILEQPAFLPLDTLPTGVSLPLLAYFAPGQAASLAPPYQSGSELRSALPSANDDRYISAHLENQKVLLAEDGLSAAASAEVRLDSSRAAGRVWVVAVAYDAQGNVVGVRRWEKTPSASPLEQGQSLAITVNVYSVSGAITRVDLVCEVRP
jgi:LysM repeat protein